jgi:monoterpene epsilon-lactone hydrolase
MEVANDNIIGKAQPVIPPPTFTVDARKVRCSSILTLGTESTVTCSSSASSSNDSSDDNESSTDSIDEYFDKNYIQSANTRAEKENEKLNLNLGMAVDLTELTRRDVNPAEISAVKRIIRVPVRILLNILDRLLSLVENPIFRFWSSRVPLKFRQKLTFAAWTIYLPIHRALIGRRSGLHPSVSLEYHALTSIMWWGRLFPVTIKRMRMCLSQLHVCHPAWAYPSFKPASNNNHRTKANNGAKHGILGHLIEVYHEMKIKRTPTGFRESVQNGKPEEMIVTGQYIQQSSRPSEKVIFWIYGGAFLAGDSIGNIGIAEKIGVMCDNPHRDCFIPDYRLVPEYHLEDALFDITLAYEYLLYERGIRPENVILLGISSGGGLLLLLMQALAEARQKYESHVELPAGGVLIGPFVDYCKPTGSMNAFIKHDLIVNQSVYDEGIPYLEVVLGCHENRVKASPIYNSFIGLPPLCICVSEHEVVYDQAIVLAQRAKKQGVDVTIGTWKCESNDCSFILYILSA